MENKMETQVDGYDKFTFHLKGPTFSERSCVLEFLEWAKDKYPELISSLKETQ